MATTDDFFLAFGPAPTGFATYGANIEWGGFFKGSWGGVFGAASSANPTTVYGTGIYGLGQYIGVYGQTDDPGLPTDSGAGVIGSARVYSGVIGSSVQSPGVFGISDQWVGIFGRSNNSAGVLGFAGDPGPVGDVAAGVYGASNQSIGVSGISTNNCGVVGQTGKQKTSTTVRRAGVLGTSSRDIGVAAISDHNFGVYAQTGRPIPLKEYLSAAVLANSANGRAVAGYSTEFEGVSGYSSRLEGVYGQSSQSYGVRGDSFAPGGARSLADNPAGVYGESLTAASGVLGVSASASGVAGVAGADGPGIPNSANIAGVVGTSDTQPGVIGTSNSGIGVFGFSNFIGVVGQAGGPAAHAGIFYGDVLVQGSFAATVKNAIVPFPDGSQRVLHCMESPEHWFEDFGDARLNRGRAIVKLDADFAKVIKSGDYRVFVTPEGDCRGLYVHRKGANGFEVRELMEGKSGIAFSYRIVGRRKDIKGHQRFARIEIRPPAPIVPPRGKRAKMRSRPTPPKVPVPIEKTTQLKRAKNFADRLAAFEKAQKQRSRAKPQARRLPSPRAARD